MGSVNSSGKQSCKAETDAPPPSRSSSSKGRPPLPCLALSLAHRSLKYRHLHRKNSSLLLTTLPRIPNSPGNKLKTIKINKKKSHCWLLISIAASVDREAPGGLGKQTSEYVWVTTFRQTDGESHWECGQPRHRLRYRLDQHMGERRSLSAQECSLATRRWAALILCAFYRDVSSHSLRPVGWYTGHPAHKYHLLLLLFGTQWVSLRLRSSVTAWAAVTWCLRRWSDKAPISHWPSPSLKYRCHRQLLPFSCHSFCFPVLLWFFLTDENDVWNAWDQLASVTISLGFKTWASSVY